MIRLDKFLADSGVGTRTDVKKRIREGRITVNDAVAKKPDLKVDPEQDQILFDHRPVIYEKYSYYLFHKPAGCVTARCDRLNRTVMDFFPESMRKEFAPVGRLDKDTEGFLLITNDGELTHRLLSPAYHVKKTYFVQVDQKIPDTTAGQFAEGVDIGDEKRTLPADLKILGDREAELTISEGRFHQVKRMFAAVGCKVVYLKRIRMGSLTLRDLEKGTYRKLTQEEIRKEVIALQDMGHKRLALEAGEHPTLNSLEYILESIRTIYSIRHKNGAIRRVNVNIAATTVENYRRLKDAGIGTYILFQETYHKKNYEALHPTGPKSNYAYHTEAMDRAMEGGIDDVGMGVLFGLNTYRYDFVGLLMHAEHLEARFGVGPHTISVPRICSADDIDAGDFPNAISDDIFSKIVAVIRIAVPYTGMIISTRESQESREKVLELGISQISGGSRTSVGGYAETELPEDNSAQFDVSDTRTLDEVVNWLLESGYIPSFCTACYREGRTGDRFMSLVKSGQIANCCGPNALMTLKEYLEDYASEDTRIKGMKLIAKETDRIPNPKIREIAIRNLKDISEGKRDFRF